MEKDMIEIVERAVRAREVETGDRLVLADRLVTQTQTAGRSVFLHHPEGGYATCDVETPGKILRRVRVAVEPPTSPQPPHGGDVPGKRLPGPLYTTETPKGRLRPAQRGRR